MVMMVNDLGAPCEEVAEGLFQLVLEPDRAAPLAGDDDVEVAVAVHVDDGNVQGRADSLVGRIVCRVHVGLGARFRV